MIKNNGPCVLMILDGWGIAGPNDNGNAVAMAKTPFLDRMISDYPNTRLQCSGPATGWLKTAAFGEKA